MTESDPNCMEDIKLSAGGGDEDSQTSECKGKEQLQSEVDTVQTQEFEQPGLLEEDVGPTLERDRRGDDGAAQHQAVTSWLQDSQPDYRRAHNSLSTVTLNSVGDSIRDSSSGGDDGDGYSMTSTRSDQLSALGSDDLQILEDGVETNPTNSIPNIAYITKISLPSLYRTSCYANYRINTSLFFTFGHHKQSAGPGGGGVLEARQQGGP